MEVHLAPDLEKRLAELAATTGRAAEDLVRDVISGYLDELTHVQETLDRRHEELESGRVEPIEGEQAFGRLRDKSRQRRFGSG